MPVESDGMLRSIGNRIVRASFAVALAHALFKIMGVLQASVMGRYIDKGVLDAIYVFAFEGCIFSFFLIGEEAIGPAFLPVFMKEMQTKDEPSAWRFANAVLTAQFLVLLVAVAGIMLGRDFMIGTFTAWDPVRNGKAWALGRSALAWLAPSLICLSIGSTTYKLLNGYKRFFLAAFGDAAWKICAFLAVVVGAGVLGLDHRCLLIGILVGSVAKLMSHLAGMLREIRFLRLNFDWRSEAVKTMALLVLPLLVGIIVAKVRDVYNNVYVLSYLNTEGLMLANSFGRKMANTISFLVPYAISIAIFPFFCELVVKNEKERLGRLLTTSARMLLSVFIPLSLVMAALARPMTSLVFYGGKFGVEDVDRTAISMACYVLVLPAMALECLLMQAFFAHRRMVSVTVVGIVFSGLSVAMSWLGIIHWGMRGTAALVVVALGLVVSRILKSTTLVVVLKRSVRVPFFPPGETFLFLVRSLVVGIVSAAVCLACIRGYDLVVGAGVGKLMLIGKLAAAGTGALIAFAVSAFILRVHEPADMLRWAMTRIRRRPADGSNEPYDG